MIRSSVLAIVFGIALLTSSRSVRADALLQAISFAITGSDATPVIILDRRDCVFRLEANTYYFNNIDPTRVTFLNFTRPVRGDYTRVGIHGKAKVIDMVSSGQTFSHADYELMVVTNEPARLIRAWQYIYANGCKGATSPF
jgi:hypothetical protein